MAAHPVHAPFAIRDIIDENLIKYPDSAEKANPYRKEMLGMGAFSHRFRGGYAGHGDQEAEQKLFMG
ncbi:hypothetical protein, partial [Victivallis vadensis]|uniref:hypothetical protein n=1 Tax=Victivallis vadensis TaxID=172901 RepID=UPI003AF47F91